MFHPGEVVQFRVNGEPVTQGSMRRGRGGRMYHCNSADLERLRVDTKLAAHRAGVRMFPEHAPVRLTLTFYLTRPASVKATKRPLPSSKKADLDKLARAMGDALTGVCYLDDSQVTDLRCKKRYADADHPPGVLVCVEPDTGEDPMMMFAEAV